jgi:replicative DNA helicase
MPNDKPLLATLHDDEVERYVLSTIATTSMLDIDGARLLIERAGLVPKHFFDRRNAALFSAARQLLFEKGSPVDPVTVKALLEGKEGLNAVGGWQYMSHVVLDDGAELRRTQFDAYASQLKKLSMHRGLVQYLLDNTGKAENISNDPVALASEIASRLAAFGSITHKVQSLNDVMEDIAMELDSAQGTTVSRLLMTGIATLDEGMGGWMPTLGLLGAEPGVGKSATLAATAYFNARRGRKVGVISLEDHPMWLGWRILAQESGINQFIMRFRKMSAEQYTQTKAGFTKVHAFAENILVCDGSENGMTADDVVAVANDMVLNHGVDGILLDHMGETIIPGDAETRSIGLARSLSRYRGVANRHGIPFVVAAHTKRLSDRRDPNDPPKMDDFAETAGAERKCRQGVIIRRQPDSDNIDFWVLKNTNGRAGFCVRGEFHGAAAMVRAVEGPMQ